MNSLVEKPAVELRRLIGIGELSPVELLQACIARIETLNPAVNAICATDFERALVAAKRAEALVARREPLPLLHGLPLGVKDLEATKDLLTTCGNVGLRGNVPTRDMALVARLRAAGAIVTCKTNTPDLGAGANTRNPVWGATGNPFNPRLNAGGSSGGSAAALATDMLPICTGSDTGGSLRIPAALCGVVGLRPSPGVIADDGRALGWTVLPVLGPMGRTVADTALLMSASAGPSPMDPLSVGVQQDAYWPVQPVELKHLRIAVIEDFGACPIDHMIRHTFRQRIDAIAREVVSCQTLNWNLEEAHRSFDVLRAESIIAALSRNTPDTLGPNVRDNMDIATCLTLADRAEAHLVQTRIMRQFQAAFDDVDLIITPVTPVSPFPWTELYAHTIEGKAMRNYYEWCGLTYIVTLATNPALALPCGVDEAGMPFGLQLIGRLHTDAALLAKAQALEAFFQGDAKLRRPRPDLSELHTSRPDLKSIVTHPPLLGIGTQVTNSAPV